MINNNIDMIQSMVKPFNYEEYVALCKKNNIQAVDLNRFCLGMGTLAVAKVRYPGMDLQEAYSKTFQDMYAQVEVIGDKEVTKPKKSSCCGQDNKKSPSLRSKVKNYTKTMARWIKAGRPIVDMETFAKRLIVCGTCESLKSYECTECGCPMDSKARMDIDKLCELKKW